VSEETLSDEPEPSASSAQPLRGSVLDVLRTLLGDHQERDTVLAIVSKLVARTTELERRLARGDTPFKVSEKVSTAQLVLFLDALKRGAGGPEHDDTDERKAIRSSSLRQAGRPVGIGGRAGVHLEAEGHHHAGRIML
jgi:hypothetical protein